MDTLCERNIGQNWVGVREILYSIAIKRLELPRSLSLRESRHVLLKDCSCEIGNFITSEQVMQG